MQSRCRVIKPYRTEYDDPLIVKVGEPLTVGGRDTQWTGWIWCWNAAGKGGWVPERGLAFTNDAGTTATMQRDYDATELDAHTGDTLTIEFEESGWLWCVNASGKAGWIPAENVEFI
jgi:hypothetical protein